MLYTLLVLLQQRQLADKIETTNTVHCIILYQQTFQDLNCCNQCNRGFTYN